jgi:demethylmenaquinone methyltransferase/2-methoxy-6-polyprenyl-1,4-benzoquinol methylase
VLDILVVMKHVDMRAHKGADAADGGTAPSSTAAVRSMFDAIANTYDLLNSILSLGLHRIWEGRLVALLTAAPAGKSLDLCTGTGALVARLSEKFGSVVAADISPQMLRVGSARHASLQKCSWVEADAQAMPFADNTFDAVTISYGIRNLPDPTKGLSEALRVAKPGGELAVLEFGQPANRLWRMIFNLYGRYVIPTIGGIISGSRGPYEYLPRTASAFPCGQRFEALLREVGWVPERTVTLCGGVAFMYKARKVDAAAPLRCQT